MKLKKVLVMLVSALTLTSCDLLEQYLIGEDDSHVHDYTYSYVSNIDGHYGECECGEVDTLQDHQWIEENGSIKYVIEVEATETTLGSKYKQCSICGYKEYEDIPKTHTHSYTTLKYDENGHWYECSCGETENSTSHTFTESITKQPTHNAVGYKTKTCSVCGYKIENIEISKVSHTYTTSYNTTQHWKVCSCGDIKDQENHTMDETITKEATYTSTGTKKHYCTGCDYYYEETLPKLEAGSWDINTIYHGYYKDFEQWTDADDLISKLHTLISTNKLSLAYGNEVIQAADEDLYLLQYVSPVYGEGLLLKTQTTNGWDKEHVFCASLMTGLGTDTATNYKGRASDYHNLFASFYEGNRSRGNNNYGWASKLDGGTLSDFRTGTNKEDGYCYKTINGNTYWEPGDIDKGRVSRALCYMPIMYNNTETYVISDDVTKYGGPLSLVEDYVGYDNGNFTGTSFAHGNASTIYTWATRDVDFAEYKHNEMVYQYQKNRNPFVDFPELVDYVYGSKKETGGKLTDLIPSYVSLGLSSDIHHYAIKEYPYEVSTGTPITKDMFKVVSVDGDLNQEEYTDFTVTGLTFGDSYDEVGTVTATLTTPINTIEFSINVVSAFTYKYNFQDGDFSASTESPYNLTKTFNNVEWLVTTQKAVTYTKYTSSTGLYQIGKAPKSGVDNSCGTFAMETVNSVTGDNQYVNRIYIEADTASGCTNTYTISIGGTVVKSGTIAHVTGVNYQIIDYTFDSNYSGNIKIEFGNITKAFMIRSIAYNVI